MRKVDDLCAADAGKEILIAAGKADHFVREGRPADDDLVVGKDELVQAYVDGLIEQAAGHLCNLCRRNLAERREGFRQVPSVIEDTDAGKFRRALFCSHTYQLIDRRFAHRRVRAQGNQVIQSGGASAEQFVKEAEQLRNGRGARAVGDEDEHPLVVKPGSAERLRHQFANLSFG